MKKYIYLLFLFFSFASFSAVFGSVKVQGKVIRYDKKTVTLSNDQKTITFPREVFPKSVPLRTGYSATAVFKNMEELEKALSIKK